jgi:hypothetical protein
VGARDPDRGELVAREAPELAARVTSEEIAAVRRDVDRHEQSLTGLWREKASMHDLDRIGRDFEALTDEVKSLRRTIIGFALTVAVSAVGIAAAVLTAGAQP